MIDDDYITIFLGILTDVESDLRNETETYKQGILNEMAETAVALRQLKGTKEYDA